MNTEIEWRQIEGFNYEVSNTGLVRNKKTNRIIKPFINISKKYNKRKNNYLRVQLSKNNKRYFYLISRLVCIAFNPNPNNFETVNHIDFNTMNNNSDNLEWMSRSDNSKLKSGKYLKN